MTRPERLLFSAIIPVYNGEKYLAAAIQSILDLQYEPFELIVVDDGSTDGTGEIARSYGSRLRYLRNCNGGPATARNFGLRHAHGDAVGFLDVDDLWTENIITGALKCLLTRPDLDIVQGQIQEIKPSAANPIGTAIEYFEEPYPYINIGSAVYRTNVFARIGGFDESLRSCEDFDWFWRAFDARISKLRIDDVTLLYRIHPAGMTYGQTLKEIHVAKVYKKAIARRQCEATSPARGFPTLLEYFGSRTHLIPTKVRPMTSGG